MKKPIEKEVFRDNTTITSVTMPDSITYMEDGVFKGCSSLVTVNLSKNLIVISKGAFYECYALENITLWDKIKKIESSAFMNCDSLTSIEIPVGVTAVEGNAFYKCDKLKTVVIGDGVKTIDSRAFADCPVLTDIYLGAGLTDINGTAFSTVGSSSLMRVFYGAPGTYGETFAKSNYFKFISDNAAPNQAYIFPKPSVSVSLTQNPSFTDLYLTESVYDSDPDKYYFHSEIANLQTVIGPNGNINVLNRQADAQGKFFIFEYSPQMEVIGAAEFKKEFEIIGAFTRDADGNYYIFYAESVTEDEGGIENMCLARYSPSGQKQKEYRVDNALNGAGGAMIPFAAGNCRMEISGGMIAVHFARGMFNGHQASFGLFFEKDTMEMVQSIGSGRSMSFTVVSHSFDQFILPTAEGFAFVDHGDANPRGFAISDAERYVVGNNLLVPFEFYNTDPSYSSPTLYNQTYAEMGGLAETDDGYIFAGTYDDSRPNEGVRNLFIVTTDKRLNTASDPVWITSYTNTDVNSPKIVRIGQDEYLLMWRADKSTYMAIVDGRGKLTVPATPLPGVTLNADDVLRYNTTTGLAHWAAPGENGKTVRLYGFDPHKAAVSAAAVQLKATPTAASVLVNGVKVDFDAYNINGNNYFKLRDLAYALSGTNKKFDVQWDAAGNAIMLVSGKTYTAVGGEMSAKGKSVKNPVPTASKMLLDGRRVFFTAYNIDGNNYFKLRDIGSAFNFGIGWNAATSTITIDTNQPYTG